MESDHDDAESTPGPWVRVVIVCLAFALFLQFFGPTGVPQREALNNSELPNCCKAASEHTAKLFMLKPIASAHCWHIVEASCLAEALEMSDATPGSVEAIEIHDGLNSAQFPGACR